MLKLDGIASFVAIAEVGSISAAARRLNLSKSVVSERLSDLEQALGAALFHRTTRKLSLTEDGTAFLEKAVRIVREVEEAAAELAERRSELTGPMRLSAPVTFGREKQGRGAADARTGARDQRNLAFESLAHDESPGF